MNTVLAIVSYTSDTWVLKVPVAGAELQQGLAAASGLVVRCTYNKRKGQLLIIRNTENQTATWEAVRNLILSILQLYATKHNMVIRLEDLMGVGHIVGPRSM